MEHQGRKTTKAVREWEPEDWEELGKELVARREELRRADAGAYEAMREALDIVDDADEIIVGSLYSTSRRKRRI